MSPTAEPSRPWLGLDSYNEDTQSVFYGRDDETAELGRRVQRKLLTVLFGQSGLGKTSILRAGIVPKLRPEGYCPIYVRIDYSPGGLTPAEQIKQAVMRATSAVGTWSKSGVARQEESLWEFFHHRDDVLTDSTGRVLTPLLIFDQFEEIFTLAQTDDAGRARAREFLRDLANLVENRAPVAIEDDESAAERFDFARADYRLLIALREDYLAHLESLRDEMPSVTQNRVRLTRMAGGPALEVVLRPGTGLVSDEVARQIVRFVAGASDLATAEVEPSLLSLVCRELNEMRIAQGRPEISADLLEGSRDTILNEFYERSLADQPEAVRRFIEDELLTDSGFRESLAEERAQKVCTDAGAPDALTMLVNRRLLRIEERLDVRRVELTHDVLCGVVKSRRDTRREREAREAAEKRAAETEAREAATRKSLRRARMIAAGCAGLALVAVASAVFGYLSLRRARAAQARADAARIQAEHLATFMTAQMRPALEQYGRLSLLEQLEQQSAAYYKAIPAELRDLDTDRKEAEVLGMLATLHALMSDNQGAADYTRACVAMREKIQAASPGDTENTAQLLLFQSRLLIGSPGDDVSADSKSTLAGNYSRLKSLRAQHPENLPILRAQADLALDYGYFLSLMGDSLDVGLAVAEDGRSLWKEITDREPDNKWNRSFRVRAILLPGSIEFGAHHTDEAVKITQEAVDYAEDALKQDPANLTLLAAAAEAAQNLVYWTAQLDVHRAAQAELIVRARFKTLMELEPTNPAHRLGFVRAHDMEGWARVAEGMWTEAAEAFHRFATLNDTLPPDNGAYQSVRARFMEGRMRAKTGDRNAADALVAAAEARSQQYLSETSIDKLWAQIEAMKVLRLTHEWSEVERRARETLSKISAELKSTPEGVTFRVYQAQAQMLLGEALLAQGNGGEAARHLGEAVTGFQQTPPSGFFLTAERSADALEAPRLWADALAATGDTARARGLLQDTLSECDRLGEVGGNRDNWRYVISPLVRTLVDLAATFDPAKPDQAARRTALLDRAAGLLEKQQAKTPLSVDDTALLTKIAALRAERGGN